MASCYTDLQVSLSCLQLASKYFIMLKFYKIGTGKTLIAKAVATECSMSFLSIKVVYPSCFLQSEHNDDVV